jgi:long-chain acyl-CoA synthetase
MLSGRRDAHSGYRGVCESEFASRPWLESEGAIVSFGQLRRSIEALGGLLATLQIRPGQRVLVATRNDAQAAQLFVALICHGVTAVNLDPEAGAERARGILRKASPSLILADREVIDRWQLAGDGARIIEIAPPARKKALFSFSAAKASPGENLTTLLDAAAPQPPPASVDPETIAYIMFTSGTTNDPKGVCISHRALFAHLSTLSRRFGYGPGSRIMNTLMLAHADGMIQGPVMAFHDRIPVHRPVRFEIGTLDRWLDAVYRLRITHLVTVPTVLALMHRLGSDQHDTFQGGDFKLLISCGAHLEAALCENIERTFRVPIVNVYGLTETVVGGVFSGPDEKTRMPGSIGMPEDCELRILGPEGTPVAAGRDGELGIRGDLLMSGYFEAPEATAQVLSEGWLKTGDMARCDAHGRYWITGRIKNIIIRGGYNIHPEEVTEALQRHPGIREAVTFGVPDPIWGETVACLVVADASVSEQSVNDHCKTHLEPRKLPSRLAFVDALPRGLSGKVQIERARELLARGPAPAAVASPDGATAERLLRVAAACFKVAVGELALTDAPRDVAGWDSLSHLEFISAMEAEFGVKLSTQEILSIDRLDKALRLVDRP